jgi:hypothetical protein
MRILVLLASLAVIRSALAEPTASASVLALDQQPEALRLIRTAKEVYVFPVRVTENQRSEVTPHGDYKRARLLGAEASRSLRRILGKESNWFHGHDSTFGMGPEPKNVGYIFRRGKDEVVLLGFMRWRFRAIVFGSPTSGSLEEKASDKLDEWKKQFARSELNIK